MDIHVYPFLRAEECCKNIQPVRWLIKGYIPHKTTCMLFGPSEHGKSFVAVDMACHIACPEIDNWHGLPLRHGEVAYFAGEGHVGLQSRIAAWKKYHKAKKINLGIFSVAFGLEKEIDSIIANVKNNFENPSLLIFDTLNRYMLGDENNASDTGTFLRAINVLIAELDCSVMIVHHSGLSASTKDRVRGSSAFRGAVDSEMRLEKDETDGVITLSQTKCKDAPRQPDRFFKLETVALGQKDEDGEPMTSCVLEDLRKNVRSRKTRLSS